MKEKQNKLLPGVHIPVLPYEEDILINNKINYAFLGAWNYEQEIKNKEKQFILTGGRFFTHVPKVRII